MPGLVAWRHQNLAFFGPLAATAPLAGKGPKLPAMRNLLWSLGLRTKLVPFVRHAEGGKTIDAGAGKAPRPPPGLSRAPFGRRPLQGPQDSEHRAVSYGGRRA